jgi:transposase InsO family protein
VCDPATRYLIEPVSDGQSRCCTAKSLDRRHWTSREQLRLAIITWIEKTYHRRRRQRRLGRLTPIEYEAINRAATAA